LNYDSANELNKGLALVVIGAAAATWLYPAPPEPPRYLRVDPGSFMMGSVDASEQPATEDGVHRVELTRAFLLQTKPVTRGQWDEVMDGQKPHREWAESSRACTAQNCSRLMVTWGEAVAYANQLSLREKLPVCYDESGTFLGTSCSGYRLPTEAEWEFVARAGLAGGIREARQRGYDPEKAETHPWGFDGILTGPLEWVQDWYGPYGGDATDPEGPPGSGTRKDFGFISDEYHRVVRGLYAREFGPYSAAWVRHHADPTEADSGIGFRMARTVP
jgi:formylglycine-generating enzyme required for sulfatase activity